jgi:hypothetical protein
MRVRAGPVQNQGNGNLGVPPFTARYQAHARGYKPGQKIVYLSAEISDCVGSV